MNERICWDTISLSYYDAPQLRGQHFKDGCTAYAVKLHSTIYRQDNARTDTVRCSQRCVQGYDVLP